MSKGTAKGGNVLGLDGKEDLICMSPLPFFPIESSSIPPHLDFLT